MMPEMQEPSSDVEPDTDDPVPMPDSSDYEVEDQDARVYDDALLDALVGFLQKLEPVYVERVASMAGQYPDVTFKDHIGLPLPSGEWTMHAATVLYNRSQGLVAPDRVDIYYGGELDVNEDDPDPDHPLRHGHVIVRRNFAATGPLDRWLVETWLAPGYSKRRMVLHTE
jgi:hypothetical protein